MARLIARSLTIIAAILLTLPSVVHAHGSDATLIHACTGFFGLTRIVGPNVSCKPGEQAVHWAITGAQGPAGPSGATGATGPAGPAGAGIELVDNNNVVLGPVVTTPNIAVVANEVYFLSTIGGRKVVLPITPAGFQTTVIPPAPSPSVCGLEHGVNRCTTYFTQVDCLGTAHDAYFSPPDHSSAFHVVPQVVDTTAGEAYLFDRPNALTTVVVSSARDYAPDGVTVTTSCRGFPNLPPIGGLQRTLDINVVPPVVIPFLLPSVAPPISYR